MQDKSSKGKINYPNNKGNKVSWKEHKNTPVI